MPVTQPSEIRGPGLASRRHGTDSLGVSKVRVQLFLCLALVLTRALAAWARPMHEQGWIHLRVGEHFAAGQGLSFNPGEPWEPLWATLSPLWSVIVGLLLGFGLTPAAALLLPQVLCELAVLWGLARLLEKQPRAALIAQASFICLPQLARVGTGGNEACLAVALALHACASARSLSGGVLGGLAAFTRPELLLLACMGRTRRFFLGWLFVVAAGIFFCQALGNLPPVSIDFDSSHIIAVLQRSFLPHWLLLPLLPLVARGAWQSCKAGGPLRSWSLLALGWILLQAGCPHSLYSWHFALPWTAWCAWLAGGVCAWRVPGERLVLAATAVGLLVVAVLAWWWYSPVRSRVHEPLVEWARTTSRLEPRARVLASDAGVVGFGWQGTVLASEGWLWPAAAKWVAVNNMIRAEWPEYVLLSLERDRLVALQSDELVSRRYEPILRFSPVGATDLHPSTSVLEAEHGSDYLVLRRTHPDR